ncbi:helix-turn-helix transcriptional regulator [Sphingosinicella rhizophila]|uniref:AraC family transcriptional regulator n=1 Tax=Sphingosinicella rhizophila TaxID=3050082 RepID=A0ABU3QCC2_9SPHN|nr:AraC family transcriptional regulator [Sphingosinicella sp. GR2756]MDT9600595.1 AraC family transcriptional regulator [Sphingosinicella sp. GR2756]
MARRFPPPFVDAVRIFKRDAIQDYAIDSADGAGDLLNGLMPQSDHVPYCWRSGILGSGRYEFCGLADGFFITFGELEVDRPQSVYLSLPDTLRVYVSSNGDGEYVSSQGDLLSLQAPNAAIMIDPAGAPTTEVGFVGRVRYACVYIHREALKTLYAGNDHELPAELQTFLQGDLQRTIARALPLSGEVLGCLDDVHACALEGHRRQLYLQSKAVEIICHALEALEHSDSFGSVEATRRTARGVLKAQRLIAQKFVKPPSLESLAHEVGLSRSRLCTGFRQILGQSVFDYIQDLRMQQALTMLNACEISISQIAYAVGYNRASSFSVAVQRYFGATPSELRQRGMLPPVK